jgi:hypothetical protein
MNAETTLFSPSKVLNINETFFFSPIADADCGDDDGSRSVWRDAEKAGAVGSIMDQIIDWASSVDPYRPLQ